MAGILDEKCRERKIQGRTNRRMYIFNPTLLYTKFEVSILSGCGDIFDEKSGEKEKGTNTRKNKLENALLQSYNTTCRCEPVYQI